MPTFETPGPIAMTVEVVLGDVRITASDRTDTVVGVRPRTASDRADRKAAEQVAVEYADGRLLVKGTKPWRHYTPFGTGGAVEVTLDVPTGSSLAGDLSMGALHGEGELGECRFKTSMGHIRLDHTGPLRLKTSHGDIVVDRAAGTVDVATGSGEVRIDEADGPVVVRNSNGDTRIGAVTGDLRVKAANGDIVVGRADRSVMARTACGDIRVGEVVRRVVDLRTGAGEIEIGIHPGTAAWLDVSSQYGRVHNALDAAEGPAPSDETVEVRARTAAGDIAIRRSEPATTTTRHDEQEAT
jgi:DUF4097 and DUF4098 domain-containing protein YvlB